MPAMKVTYLLRMAIIAGIFHGNAIAVEREEKKTNENFPKAKGNFPQCQVILNNVLERSTVLPLNLTGRWTSIRCEIRPGPQFVLRDYTFENEGQFLLSHHYYLDAACTRPSYTVTSRGKVMPTSEVWAQSFRIPGATEVSYVQKKVAVRPHTKQKREEIRDIWRSKCRGCEDKTSPSNSRKTFPFYHSFRKCDCLEAINFHLGELEIMKIIEKYKSERSLDSQLHLYVGNVKTKYDSRYYLPSTYQDPMMFARRQRECDVCERILHSTSHNPPILLSPFYSFTLFPASWVSVRCEVRPGKIFLTRELYFMSSSTWHGTYSYFKDPGCSSPTYKLRAIGRYTVGKPSRVIDGAFESTFEVLELYLTTQNETVTALFNSYRGLLKPQIKTYTEFQATKENGLDAIGLYLPHKEYEILRIVKNGKDLFLFTGRRPTVGGRSPNKPGKRATSFQDELQQCDNAEIGSDKRWDVSRYQFDNNIEKKQSSYLIMPSKAESLTESSTTTSPAGGSGNRVQRFSLSLILCMVAAQWITKPY
ncbi:protein APCDD1-like isoform X2 [Clavelina lepadiformis]|uniref:APCDD1 domain-containing protein n=1 Tax=Clavelina lepadiformis TaxID=159417 RepID=A0ABP0GWH0_CLALP